MSAIADIVLNALDVSPNSGDTQTDQYSVAIATPSLAEQNQLFITRVPQKLKEAKVILAKALGVAWTELKDGYTGAWFDSNYGGAQQRWLLLKSAQAKSREKHILDAAISKKTERAVIDFKKLMRQEFACDTDARKALQLWLEKREFIRIHNLEITRHEKRTKRGRPGLNNAVITTDQTAPY